MKRIHGRDCTLTVRPDQNTLIPLPYAQETVRESVDGYTLDPVTGSRKKEQFFVTGRTIQGIFRTRLDIQCIKELFNLLHEPFHYFDLIQDHVEENKVYKNLQPYHFELKADNKEPFYFTLGIKHTKESYTEEFTPLTIAPKWTPERTFYFDGHTVRLDGIKLPLVYRIELKGIYEDKTEYTLNLYMPYSTPQKNRLDPVNHIEFFIDYINNIKIDIYNLLPLNDLANINCPDTVLLCISYKITGSIKITQRTEAGIWECVL